MYDVRPYEITHTQAAGVMSAQFNTLVESMTDARIIELKASAVADIKAAPPVHVTDVNDDDDDDDVAAAVVADDDIDDEPAGDGANVAKPRAVPRVNNDDDDEDIDDKVAPRAATTTATTAAVAPTTVRSYSHCKLVLMFVGY